jgi:hypothetical protein
MDEKAAMKRHIVFVCDHNTDNSEISIGDRVARWFLFKPNIPILVQFWRTLEWKKFLCIYSGHLEYFTTIGYILLVFVNFVVIWYLYFSPLCTKKNLATLIGDESGLMAQLALRCSVWIVNYLRTDLLCMLCYKQKGTG